MCQLFGVYSEVSQMWFDSWCDNTLTQRQGVYKNIFGKEYKQKMKINQKDVYKSMQTIPL